ncbi:MAG TPA: tyrosine-type recombinase/integrase [Saprospiraceae bacterium]|nr:tyrosine-type recombinase/integrase [Saprospiraceae bacterium]
MGRPSDIIVIKESNRNLSSKYYEHQKRMGYSLDTCRARQLYVEEWMQYSEQKGIEDIRFIPPYEIQNYYHYIGERPNKKDKGGTLSQKTTWSMINAITIFFTMLQNSGEIQVNPCSTIKIIYPRDYIEREVLTLAEINNLYEHCITAHERAMLSLAYGLGMRVGEIEKMKIEDVKLKDKIMIIPSGKGNKRRVIPMSPGVIKDLSDYYYQEYETLTKGKKYDQKEQAFLLNKNGSRMREYTMNKNLKRIIEKTTIEDKNITMHSLRHSIASHLIEQGLPVDQVRQFLGHSQLETTQTYTHINKQQLKRLINDDERTTPEGIEYDSARSERTTKVASTKVNLKNNDP